MNFTQLWKKLFSKRTQEEDIGLHVAGAMLPHRNPFESLDIPRNDNDLPREFINKFVVPFYMASLSGDRVNIEQFATVAKEITLDDVKLLLGDFNWRTRISAAFFAAINNYSELDEIIGRHLVKSEVVYAGDGYCLALATFGTDKSKEYLKKYLDYYLERKDLWYDQNDAICALEYLDKDSALKYMEQWNSFVADKPNWNLNKHRKYFADEMSTLELIRKAKA